MINPMARALSARNETQSGRVSPLDRALFEAVQEKLAARRPSFFSKRAGSAALLIGKLYDERGHRMTPSPCAQGRATLSLLRLFGPQPRPPGGGPLDWLISAAFVCLTD
jgi:hypothetical protein